MRKGSEPMQEITKESIDKILSAYPRDQRHSLAMMQDMQHHFNYIPEQGMQALAEYLDCPLSSLYSMATFYRALSLKPKGKHIIKLCDGTACHIRGSVNLITGIKRELDISPGETSGDGLFSLETVNCLGSCALAPVMVIDGVYYGKVTLEKLPEILNQYREVSEGGAEA